LQRIRILVVDDHEIVRRCICEMLAGGSDIEVVCDASDGYEAVRKAGEFQPDVVLLDISIPELNGLQATPLIIQAAKNAQILIVTNHDQSFFVREAFGAGARGFLLKSDIPGELEAAIRQVHLKQRFVSRTLKESSPQIWV
jgi:DNA-binding NarL/FixJ family response regulator